MVHCCNHTVSMVPCLTKMMVKDDSHAEKKGVTELKGGTRMARRNIRCTPERKKKAALLLSLSSLASSSSSPSSRYSSLMCATCPLARLPSSLLLIPSFLLLFLIAESVLVLSGFATAPNLLSSLEEGRHPFRRHGQLSVALAQSFILPIKLIDCGGCNSSW